MSRESDILGLEKLIYKFLHTKNLYINDDLVQCCWEYAIKAVDSHDPDKASLYTHVSWSLMAAMKHYFYNENKNDVDEYNDEETSHNPRPDQSIALSELLTSISDVRGCKALELKIAGYSVDDIAVMMDDTNSNIRYFLRKTRAELRELYGLE